MWNETGDLNLMMFAGKEVRLLTILYKKHSLAIVLLGCLLPNDTYNLKDYLKMSTMPTSMHESLELPPSTESAESGRKILSRRDTMHGLG